MRLKPIFAIATALVLCALFLAPVAQAQGVASVAGTVLAPDGQPLLGAIVELTLDGKVVDTDVTSFDGRFNFQKLRPTGPYEVVVSLPEVEPLRSGRFTLSPGQTMDATVTFD